MIMHNLHDFHSRISCLSLNFISPDAMLFQLRFPGSSGLFHVNVSFYILANTGFITPYLCISLSYLAASLPFLDQVTNDYIDVGLLTLTTVTRFSYSTTIEDGHLLHSTPGTGYGEYDSLC
ncbi:hypothetical protein BDV12DRAFT_142960 [Aspergillus spectabilis]